MKLSQITADVERLEALLRDVDVAETALREAADKLDDDKSLDQAKVLAASINRVWHNGQHWAHPDAVESQALRDLSDRASALVKRLTAPIWTGNVRTEVHQITYRLGPR